MRFRPVISYLPSLLAENPGFWRFCLALLVSSTGDRFGSIAMNLYVLKLTGSGGALAGMLAVQSLPSLFIAPLAGVWIDRLSRRRVLLLDNLEPCASCEPGVPRANSFPPAPPPSTGQVHNQSFARCLATQEKLFCK